MEKKIDKERKLLMVNTHNKKGSGAPPKIINRLFPVQQRMKFLKKRKQVNLEKYSSSENASVKEIHCTKRTRS